MNGRLFETRSVPRISTCKFDQMSISTGAKNIGEHVWHFYPIPNHATPHLPPLTSAQHARRMFMRVLSHHPFPLPSSTTHTQVRITVYLINSLLQAKVGFL